MDAPEIEKAVERRRVWLDKQLHAAATALDVSVAGEPVNTFDMRSAGAVARDQDGDVWLRVVVEDADYQPVCRWDGNVAANSEVRRARRQDGAVGRQPCTPPEEDANRRAGKWAARPTHSISAILLHRMPVDEGHMPHTRCRQARAASLNTPGVADLVPQTAP